MKYPWQEAIWHKLSERHQANQLGHAQLLVGEKGIGKLDFAKQFAAYLLCQQPKDGEACGECHSCNLWAAGSHPDCVILQPEATGKMIKIDQVREVTGFVEQTSLQAGYKVVLVEPVEALNINAANALLKSLEEPTDKTLFLLVTSQLSRVMPTIKSRCQRLDMPFPNSEASLAWLKNELDNPAESESLLQQAFGSPLLARDLAADDKAQLLHQLKQDFAELSKGRQVLLSIAQRWQQFEPLEVVDYFLTWLSDVVRWQVTQDVEQLATPELQNSYQRYAEQISTNDLYLYLDRVMQYKDVLLQGNNPNKQLLWEELLLTWNDLLH